MSLKTKNNHDENKALENEMISDDDFWEVVPLWFDQKLFFPDFVSFKIILI